MGYIPITVKLPTVVEVDHKAPFFNSYYTNVLGRVLLLSLDCSNLPLMLTLYCWVLSKEVSRTILKVFGMTRPGTEPRSPRPLAGALPTRSNQRLWKLNVIPPGLTLNNKRYISTVKWSNPGKGVAPSPKSRCSSYWKGSLLVAPDYYRP